MANPKDPFHAHVYYDTYTRVVAQQLHQDLGDRLASRAMPGLIGQSSS